MIQVDKVQEIRRRWEEAGRPVCTHQDREREYYLGSDTGDDVCLKCGKTLPRTEWRAVDGRDE